MKKSSVLMMSIIAVSLSMLAGCNNSIKYRNNSKNLDKTTLGEASINNISKYTAIGVGKLDKASPNKKYRLITDKNDDEDIANGTDLSNTLVGLTTEGVLEELSLTIQNGQSLNSSNLNVTFFQELGDFVLISLLPMDVNEYISGVIGDDRITQSAEYLPGIQIIGDETYRISYKECVAYGIETLNYPLKYSIRYYDEIVKEYKYIDTSYLIHKHSGKIYPFSSRKYCVNPKKCLNGEFLNPTVMVNDEEATSYPINNLVKYYGYESLQLDYTWDSGLKQPILSVWNGKVSYFTYNFGDVQTFDNGFAVITAQTDNIALERDYVEVNWEQRYLHTVLFDETSSLQITDLKVGRADAGNHWGEENVVEYRDEIKIDRFGNFPCAYKGRTMYYNVYSKQFARTDWSLSPWQNFDPWTKQYYCWAHEDVEREPGMYEGVDFAVFLNEKLEEDYRRERDCFRFEYVPGLEYDMFLEQLGRFLEESEEVDDRTRLVYTSNAIIKVSLDENRHYKNERPSIYYEAPAPIFARNKEYCYYSKDFIIHKVNLNTLEDTVFVSLEEYPFVDKISMDNHGLIVFEGMDNQLNTILGYVYPDGTITFDISEFEVDSQTTTLSPIN